MPSLPAAVTIQRPERFTAPATELVARSPGALAEISSSAWDELLGPGNTPLRHGLLRAWEQAELRGLQSHPLTVRDQRSGELLGACPGYFYDLDLLTIRWPRTAGVMRTLRRGWPGLLYTRAYELGTAVPLSNPFLVSGDADRKDAIAALLRGGVDQARAGDAAFLLVQNFTSCEGLIAQQLRNQNMAPVPIPPTAVIDIVHESFEDYLNAMRAPYRRRARLTFARTEHLVIEHHTEFSMLAEELARLWRAIYDRATEIRREVLTAQFFRWASAVDESSVLLARRPDDSIASFALLFDDGPTLSFVQCGFEERAGREEGAYFRLLYEIVRLGIERGHRLVDLGVTTLPPKLDVGAIPVPLFAWVRHRNAAVQWAIVQLARGPLQRVDVLTPRRVFKKPTRTAGELVRELG